MPRDQLGRPERAERPSPGSLEALRQRLDRLPPSHPSSPRYRDGEIKPVRMRDFELPPDGRENSVIRARPVSADSREKPAEKASDQTDQRQPAALREEWQETLQRGEVDRVGVGVVDERNRRFQPPERRIADWLAYRGAAVVALPEDSSIRARKPDAQVDGRVTEFKNLQPGATDGTVNNRLLNARGQAEHVVIDARDSGLDEMSARRGIARFAGSPWQRGGFDSILIVGEDFSISQGREGGDDERG